MMQPSDRQPSKSEASMALAGFINLSAAWFGLSYLWSGLHAILLPLMLIGLVPEAFKNTFLGVLTFAGLIMAMLTQPIAGAISDRSGLFGRFGKRRPWMVLGTGADLIFLLLLGLATQFWWLLLAYVGLQIASSFAEASLQGLLPDLVPNEQRGRGSGYKNAAQIAGFVAGVGIGGFLAGRGQIREALLATGIILVGTTAWTSLGVHEEPVARARTKSLSMAAALRTLFIDSFRIDQGAAPGYLRLLAGRGLLMAGFFALQGFAQYFVADVMPVENPAATTAFLMAVMGAAIFLLAVPTGVLADRYGRRPLNLVSGLLGAAAALSLVFVGNVAQLIIAGGFVGASAGIFLSVNWAWAADLVPPDEAGRYLGLGNLATAGASAFSRLFAGPIIDAGNALQIGLGYHVLFGILAVGMVAGTYLLAGVPETRGMVAEPAREILRREGPE
ncbi:MAG: MFS transporter [Chloroflexota bacterium]|nr:MFS transporter [Chloroflexota bacterium]